MKRKLELVTRLSVFLLFFSGIFGLNLTSQAQEIFVSPLAGDDLHDGTKQNPLATLSEAQKRAYQMATDKTSEVIVWLQEGTYQISNPLLFESVSATNSVFSLHFKALPGTHPVVSGGIQLSGWIKKSDGLWEVQLPKPDGKTLQPRELFIGKQRAKRARFPSEGYLRIKQAGPDRRTSFFFEEYDFPVPNSLDDVELVVLHDWSISRNPVKEINGEKNQLITNDSIGAKNPAFFNLDHWEPNPRYFLENAVEFMDEDYEWVFDSGHNKIIAKFPDHINPNQTKTTIPLAEVLVVFQGSKNHPVKNIHFEGIAFCYSAWNIPDDGYCGIQACHFDPRPQSGGWSVVPAAITANWAENCSFVNCIVENTGGSGIWLGTGCKNNTVSNSVFTGISGNGIMIGEGRDREIDGEKWYKTAPEQVALGNSILNCKVKDCGTQFYGAVGIWCGLTAETTIRGNEIYDLPYTGISVGWMWSPEPTPCRENTIDGNHIHHIMNILSDGGGIYMLGLQPGSRIINNHIHDVKINAGRAESNGMFLDEGTTDVVVANNLIYSIAKSPLRFHKATTNLVKDNYLFCQNENPPIRYNSTREELIQKVDNIVFSDKDTNYLSELNKAILIWKNSEKK